ncbi:hypothetical protein [Pseudoponticoccus marisrubri]|nr:hypothetical protein [Pseudoponticoccus marisrubri]
MNIQSSRKARAAREALAEAWAYYTPAPCPPFESPAYEAAADWA